ncbi:MAG: tRNA pseudouridine(38-40) synthase TruA [Actinomycetota bacterium]
MIEPVDLLVDGFSRYRINLGYDGTDFSGFVKQPGLRTVQAELLSALEKIFGKDAGDFGMRVAGRTDAGVHAEIQVCHIDLSASQLTRIGRNKDIAGRLNSMLPMDVRVYSFELAPEGFDARHSASFRRYRYRIADSKSHFTPLQSRYLLQLKFELSVSPMKRAAKVFIGLHDFAAFCKPREGATTIRNLKRLSVTRNPEGIIEIELEADAFCHNMVRSMVGALVAVGSGKAEVSDVAARLQSASRAGSYKVVGPEGLALIEVGYPKDSLLAAQAKKARNTRSAAEIRV